ncbi:hypothetical protein LSH36_272g06034 [Paralvinella palmiformis]|uniref:CCDC174 alpha/beta GRSR domain-containing protein n=1 Tax=Paralvinella palmiformis TaxID=53620 RepID=A0AAD9N2H0_9ANNE|nr:hypothetical protein LSH36_272g06034 [Paralvinella palmiformis]
MSRKKSFEGSGFFLNQKSNIWSRSNAGVRERAEKDLEAKKEEDDVLAKSRKMLEAKARAYEKLVSGNIIPDEETSQRFLVDFEQKSIDKVDYVDSLGRSRRCMEKDLPELKKMDRELVGKKTLLRDADINDSTLPELMSDDMYKERLRAKWEEEERRNMEQPESHYANVQFDEVRDHGVAFYQFDKDAETRQQQMEKLAALREKVGLQLSRWCPL